ncbi:MAG: hypothetical protein P8169_11230, partial [Chloroflexota bacterium]
RHDILPENNSLLTGLRFCACVGTANKLFDRIICAMPNVNARPGFFAPRPQESCHAASLKAAPSPAKTAVSPQDRRYLFQLSLL